MASDSYLGNPLIKKSNVAINFTAEQIQEYVKCAKDPVYFIQNYVKIVNIDLGLVTFKLYPYQQSIVESACDNRFVICKMPRQCGKTTTIVGVILWHTLFNENYNVAILAHKAAQSREILSRIQFAYEHLPKWLQQGVVEWNKGNIELENGSKILASATSSSAIRGGSFNCISGNSNITILFDNKEFDITIDQLNILLANSSRNINIINNEIQDILLDEVDLDVFREQIHKMVLSNNNQRKNPLSTNNRQILNRVSSHNSKMYGRNGRNHKFSISSNKRTYISSSSINKNDFRKQYKEEITFCIQPNDQWQTRNHVENELVRSNVLYKRIVQITKRPYDREISFQRNKNQNVESSQGKNSFRGNETETIYCDEREKCAQNYGMETKNFFSPYRNEKNQNSFGQSKQEPRKNTKNCGKTPRNEKNGRIQEKNERSSQGKNSLEQRIEIKTANGFKKFRGIRKTLKQPVIQLILSCGNSIICTPNHKISTTLGWKEAKGCGGFYVNTQYGHSIVDSIINANSTDVFDILHVEDENSFYANNILVHNCIYLDEFAFVPNNLQEQFFASVYPTISSGSSSKVLITSTPNGLNLFYKLWADSQDGKNDYKGIEVHWSETPGRDEQWKQQTIRNTSEQQFRVEYGTEFLGSSNTLIDPAKLQTLVFTYPIKTVSYFGSDLKVYTAPIKNNKYIITVDVAHGAGLDYSICQVIDITYVPYKQVATYKNNTIHTLVFPDVIRNIAIYYNEALILVEINDIGKQVVDSLHYDLEYEGILTVDKSIAAGQKLTGGFGTRTQMGVRTTTQVKRIGCSNLKTLIESDKLLLCDFDTINELFRFVSTRNTFQAEDGNDDLVMGLVLFSWLINQPYFKDMSENDVHKVLVEAAMENDLLSFIVDEDYMSYGSEPIDVSPDQFDPFLAN